MALAYISGLHWVFPAKMISYKKQKYVLCSILMNMGDL